VRGLPCSSEERQCGDVMDSFVDVFFPGALSIRSEDFHFDVDDGRFMGLISAGFFDE